MLGTNQAQQTIRILTLADLPMTFKRKVREFFTGSPLSKEEIYDGSFCAMSYLSQARYWAGTSREAAGDNQLLALENEDASMHFIVKRAIHAAKQH